MSLGRLNDIISVSLQFQRANWSMKNYTVTRMVNDLGRNKTTRG